MFLTSEEVGQKKLNFYLKFFYPACSLAKKTHFDPHLLQFSTTQAQTKKIG